MRKENAISPISLGVGIRISRELQGLSQKDLAEMSGVSLRQLKRIESGRVMPRLGTIEKIGRPLDMTSGQIGSWYR